MIKLIVLSTILSFSFSCSKSSTSGSGVSRFQFLSYSPVFPKVQKEICDPDSGSTYSPSFLSAILNGQRDTIYVLQNSFKYSSNKIQSSSFKESLTDFKIDSDITYYYEPESEQADEDGYTSSVSKLDYNPGKDVEVCPELSIIEENTVENATLMVHYIINKTNTAFALNDINLEALSFKVAPSISTKQKVIGGPYDIPRLQLRGGVKTDNAYYNSDKKEIVFLPQSKEGIAVNLFGTVPLWEIPMVASHEYGHHAFATIMYNYSPTDKTNTLHLCFDNQASSEFISPNTNLIRSTDIHKAMSSMNEGFADLVSFYALSDEESSLKTITCMEQSRDIAFVTFKNGDKKIFSKKVIADMTNENVLNSSKSCTVPDFQEIHDLGAVFASISDKLISRKIYAKDKKFSIIVAWLTKMNQEYKSQLSSLEIEEAFQTSFEILAKVLIDSGYEKDSPELCRFIGSKFSSMDETYNWKYLEQCL